MGELADWPMQPPPRPRSRVGAGLPTISPTNELLKARRGPSQSHRIYMTLSLIEDPVLTV